MPQKARRDKLIVRLSHATTDDHSHVRTFTLSLQRVDASFLYDRYEYTYKFKPAPRQDDPVIKCIRKAITQCNDDPEHGVRMYNHNIRVQPSTSAPPIWPPSASDEDLEIKFYTFFQDAQEFPATVPVSSIPREGPLTVDKIHVRQGDKWVPIKKWLLELGDDSIFRKRSASAINGIWVKRNPKKFRLMDLPVEIRSEIFERVIVPKGEI